MNLNLTQSKLRSLLRYDEATGEFTWIVGQRAGTKAGYSVSTGYIKLNIEKVTYLAHRLAWLYVHGVWPTKGIDHVNGAKADNRFSNLRDVSQTLNAQNLRQPTSKNRSNALGVGLHHTGKYRARILVDGKERHIGVYPTVAEAQAAYVEAKRKYHAGCTL